MSNEAVALIGVGGTIAGVIVASAFNLASSILNRRFAAEDQGTERREWYRRTLFGKRLDAIQQGYHWLMKLNRATSQPQAQTPGSEQNQALARLSQEAREWYDANCVFLEDTVPQSSLFIGALNSAGTKDWWKACIDAEKELRERLRHLLQSERAQESKRATERDER